MKWLPVGWSTAKNTMEKEHTRYGQRVNGWEIGLTEDPIVTMVTRG